MSENPDESHCLQIGVPKGEVWKALVRDLNLKPKQASVLWITIRHASDDLKEHFTAKSKRRPRAMLVDQLGRMEKAFSEVRSEMDRCAHLMNDFLSADLLMHLGNWLTFSAMNEALGEDVCPKNSITRIIREIGNPDITIADLESYYTGRRHVLGLKKGHLLLKHMIETVHDSLRKFIEEDKLNEGGRPPNIARRILVYRLAEMAPEILGRPAAIAKSGPFVRLCSEVLPACELSADGIDAAIPEIVREMRARHQRRIE
jgi:hypothetical protein